MSRDAHTVDAANEPAGGDKTGSWFPVPGEADLGTSARRCAVQRPPSAEPAGVAQPHGAARRLLSGGGLHEDAVAERFNVHSHICMFQCLFVFDFVESNPAALAAGKLSAVRSHLDSRNA